ncbi:hypothetical protein JOF56_008899 [Kibdelosporangium banguiense]|uniref:Thioesterase domain-containing protein n=1 Tax=Kibdelosporangium banguiense TaxID=1365924 RepID=A0ABS4TVS0_9PSEU|nr:hypothetical protein [Kibdelosporangium banguiense]MBP2328514.1 hypothetical protein [Kibdelosporangium banguiense]
MESTKWQLLCDRGPDLVLCLDFLGGRAAAGFAELAAGIPAELCFLHIGQSFSGGDPRLDAQADEWVREALGTGRPVRAVLGYCAGAALATRVADAICVAVPVQPPVVVLLDAVAVTGATLCDQFVSAVESSSAHLAAGELDDARHWSDGLLGDHPDDLPCLAAGLTDRYDRLMAGVAGRLSLGEFFRRELTAGFASYLTYLLLAGQGGLDLRAGTPLFLSSRDHEPAMDPANSVSLDVDREHLLRDTDVLKLVAGLLTEEPRW